MKLRGAGWLLGTAVSMTVLGSVAACDDGETGGGIAFDSGPIALPDGGGVDGSTTQQKDGSVITTNDAGTDAAQQDASLPAQCNDGKLDLGETCDPLDKCPTDCPADACNLRALENGGTCAAVCTTVAVQTQCQNGDGCCPTDCSIANDNDCTAVCGNGVKEAGEKCDGADCPTDCPPIGCIVRKLVNAGTCTAECVDAQTPITTCGAVADGGAASDQCCPTGCTSGNDPDCAAGACGNNVFDPPGETCDTGIPAGSPNSCPNDCPAQACNLFTLENRGTCQAECKPNGQISQCINGDGCCAAGCNATNDSDCTAACGNDVTEPPGETCDGNCPTSCPQIGCNLYTLQNAGTCTAKCALSGTQTTCVSSDGCCPTGCTNANDNDCTAEPPTCGNGKLDPNETCDFNDPAHPCPVCNKGVTCVGSTGSASTCDVVCDQPINNCSGLKTDACCPFASKTGGECNGSSDVDCNSRSGWKVVQLPDPISLKSGACVTLLVTNVEAGGAYDVTTCGQDPSSTIGDTAITSVSSSSGITFPGPEPQAAPAITINYGSNDDCTNEKSSIPYRASLSCNNSDGKPTMSCVSEGPGGFFAKNANDLKVTICAVGGGAKFPFNVFYNAVSTPSIKLP